MNFEIAKILKSCPFCKAKNYIDEKDKEYIGKILLKYNSYFPDNAHEIAGYIVECDMCGARTGYYDTAEKAIRYWNNAKR